MAYKLKNTLVGHKADVRAVIPSLFPTGGILSVSRDQSCRLWVPDNETNTFNEGHVFLGHSNFVASVCTLPASEKYPHGKYMLFIWLSLIFPKSVFGYLV